MVNNEEATNWFDLQRRLFDFPPDPAINRFRTSFVFRGLANGDHEQMTTSLMRLRGDYALKERSLLRNFQKYAYLDVAGGNSMWHWLAMGQHYGLPTRLLDWSFSPYVALHFATANLDHMETDGVIWCVDLDETNEHLTDELPAILRRESAHVFTAEMLQEAAMTLEDLDRLPGEFALWLEPPSLDARIVNQFALFSLMSSPTALFDRWLEEHSRTACRIVIPAELKWEVRDKLDQANITERVIFPGLAGLSAWLRRHYYTRRPPPERPAPQACALRPGIVRALSTTEHDLFGRLASTLTPSGHLTLAAPTPRLPNRSDQYRLHLFSNNSAEVTPTVLTQHLTKPGAFAP